jgi:hypothetical protein
MTPRNKSTIPARQRKAGAHRDGARRPGADDDRRDAEAVRRMLDRWRASDLFWVIAPATFDALGLERKEALSSLGVAIHVHPAMEPDCFALMVRPEAKPRNRAAEKRARDIIEQWGGLFERLSRNDGPTDVCPDCQFESRNGHSPACSGEGRGDE